VPDGPQLFGSPISGVVVQLAPGGQVHEPLVQISATAQVMPQPPQFRTSAEGETQLVPHRIWPARHDVEASVRPASGGGVTEVSMRPLSDMVGPPSVGSTI